MIIGIRKGRIEWAISGLLKDSASMASAIRSWVENEQIAGRMPVPSQRRAFLVLLKT